LFTVSLQNAQRLWVDLFRMNQTLLYANVEVSLQLAELVSAEL